MEPFTRVTAVAVPIDLPNIDTDRVIPARFLRKDRSVPEYSSFLFHDVRFTAAGARRQLHDRPGATLTVDLETQTVTAPDGARHRFEVDDFRKEMLLTGRDEIGLTLGFESKIAEFEARHAQDMAWAVPPRAGT